MSSGFLLTYGAVLVSEILGDKLAYSAGVLATRYRLAPILAGMAAAFLVKTAAAVMLGSVIATLPPIVVAFTAIVLFEWSDPGQVGAAAMAAAIGAGGREWLQRRLSPDVLPYARVGS